MATLGMLGAVLQNANELIDWQAVSAIAAFFQALFAFIAAVLLWLTLSSTRNSQKNSEAALSVSQDMLSLQRGQLQMQMRPYLNANPKRVEMQNIQRHANDVVSFDVIFEVEFENVGASTALKCSVLCGQGNQECNFDFDKNEADRVRYLNPRSLCCIHFNRSVAVDFSDILSGNFRNYFSLILNYEDIHQVSYQEKLEGTIEGSGVTILNVLNGVNNSPDLYFKWIP